MRKCPKKLQAEKKKEKYIDAGNKRRLHQFPSLKLSDVARGWYLDGIPSEITRVAAL